MFCMVWAGALVNHPHEMGKHIEMVFKKNSLTPNAASHNTTSWCTDTDGFLEHSPSRGSLCVLQGAALQKMCVWCMSPLYVIVAQLQRVADLHRRSISFTIFYNLLFNQ